MSKLSLRQFMLRSEVLKLYREMIRLTYKIENTEYRTELQRFIRTDFDNNRHHTEEAAIKMMIARGKMSKREIEQAVHMAK